EIKLECKKYGISVNPLPSKISSLLKHKGHILRFIFLPLLKKPVYFFKTLFPSKKFLVDRYDLQSLWQVFLWRIFRPVDMIIKCFY
ncbi:MAG: hypothetical protein QME68_06995, partial [Elusimicrobiota bacterium]|nr:hypothetical protein [Elusimicrobiota bacterium]